MSFAISLYVKEGLVLAADSRTTLNRQIKDNDGTVIDYKPINKSDSNMKLFSVLDKYAISTCGDASINNAPIAGYIDQFINEKCNDKTQVDEIPKMLYDFLTGFSKSVRTIFHIAGYKVEEGIHVQHLYRLFTADGVIKRVNRPDKQGASWDGQADTLSRLINSYYWKNDKGEYIEVPQPEIPWNFFTLQDAVDFSLFAMRTTIDSLRFQSISDSVGGPIDILVIKPNGLEWLQKKELRLY